MPTVHYLQTSPCRAAYLPSANLYLKNKSGEIIGVEELRDILIADGELIFNREATNWGHDVSMADSCGFNGYREYMAKNLIRIRRYKINGYGIDGNGVVLVPEKYMRNEVRNFDENYQKDCVTSREYFWRS